MSHITTLPAPAVVRVKLDDDMYACRLEHPIRHREEVPRYLIIGPAWWMLSRVWDMQVIRDLVRQLEIAKGLLLTESDNISISM